MRSSDCRAPHGETVSLRRGRRARCCCLASSTSSWATTTWCSSAACSWRVARGGRGSASCRRSRWHTASRCVLAAMRIVNPPPGFVEPAIAVTIAYVALENLIGDPHRSRWPTAFGFGLIHGFGFAGMLDVLDLPARSGSAPCLRSMSASRSVRSPSWLSRCPSSSPSRGRPGTRTSCGTRPLQCLDYPSCGSWSACND